MTWPVPRTYAKALHQLTHDETGERILPDGAITPGDIIAYMIERMADEDV